MTNSARTSPSSTPKKSQAMELTPRRRRHEPSVPALGSGPVRPAYWARGPSAERAGCERHPTRAWTVRIWRTVHPEATSTPRNPSHSLFSGQCDSSLRVREFSDKECLQAAPNAEPTTDGSERKRGAREARVFFFEFVGTRWCRRATRAPPILYIAAPPSCFPMITAFSSWSTILSIRCNA